MTRAPTSIAFLNASFTSGYRSPPEEATWGYESECIFLTLIVGFSKETSSPKISRFFSNTEYSHDLSTSSDTKTKLFLQFP